MAFTYKDSDIKYDRMAKGLYNRNEIHQTGQYFFRTGYMNPWECINTTREYVFFTRPDLHLFDGSDPNSELSSIPFFANAYNRYKDNMILLQSSYTGPDANKSNFIVPLTGDALSTMELSSITSDKIENMSNVYGYSVSYRGTSFASFQDQEFTMEFTEDKYANTYMLFKIWDEYEIAKQKGIVTPPSTKYRIKRILHDQISVYKFIVAEDGETIIFFAKGFGVYPTSVPREAYSNIDEKGNVSVNITFNCEWLVDNDPMIISHFKQLVKGYSDYPILSTWDSVHNCASNELAISPDIEYGPSHLYSGKSDYRLIWRGDM